MKYSPPSPRGENGTLIKKTDLLHPGLLPGAQRAGSGDSWIMLERRTKISSPTSAVYHAFHAKPFLRWSTESHDAASAFALLQFWPPAKTPSDYQYGPPYIPIVCMHPCFPWLRIKSTDRKSIQKRTSTHSIEPRALTAFGSDQFFEFSFNVDPLNLTIPSRPVHLAKPGYDPIGISPSQPKGGA